MTENPLPFQTMFLEQRGPVLRLLVGMVGPADADDCFQDAFLKALRAWPPSDTGTALGSWMLTVAHRTALDHLRRRVVRDRAAADHGAIDTVPDQRQAVPVDDSLLWADSPDGLWATVRTLPDKQRAAVVLHLLLDQSHAQVAVLIGCSEQAARRSYADALARLRSRVADGALEVTR